MFAEENIFGVQEVNSDNKGRIVLPSFTHAEKDDAILIIKEQDLLKIAQESQINDMLDELESAIELEIDNDKKNYLQNKLYNLYESIVKKCIVDGQKRINLGDSIDHESKYKIIGARNQVLLKKI